MRNKYLDHAHVSKRDFRVLLKCFANDVTALTAAKLCGLNKNTTHRIYFGPRRVRGRRGRGAGRKVPVIGLLKRAGKVFTQVVHNCSKKSF